MEYRSPRPLPRHLYLQPKRPRHAPNRAEPRVAVLGQRLIKRVASDARRAGDLRHMPRDVAEPRGDPPSWANNARR